MDILSLYPSFVAPARIRTLVLPIGTWTRTQFRAAIAKLRQYDEVRLLDITPIDNSLFTPQGFPNGRLLFDFTTVGTNDDDDSFELFLYDFQPFRKLFVIIGLVNDTSDPKQNLKLLKEKYPAIISYNLIYTSQTGHTLLTSSDIDTESKTNNGIELSHHVFQTDLAGGNAVDNLETIMCDIGRNFLESLTLYYSSYKHVTLRSPGAIGGNSVARTVITRYSSSSKPRNPSLSSPSQPANSKRLSSFEMTTNSLKRSASLKLANSLTSSDSKAQRKAKGRQLKILGNFQLIAGRYMDALDSFLEAVTILHKLRDYLWLGSALNGVAICFVLLSYLRIPFQIPEIIDILCPVHSLSTRTDTGDDGRRSTSSGGSSSSGGSNRASYNSHRNSAHTKLDGAVGGAEQLDSSSRNSLSKTNSNQLQSPRNSLSNIQRNYIDVDVEKINMPLLIKTISDKILFYYEQSLSHNTEYVPQVVYCNLVMKTLSFMVTCHNSAVLTPEILNNIVRGTPPDLLVPASFDDYPGNECVFSKDQIFQYAYRLFELQLQNMSIEQQIRLHVLMAKVFKVLGLQRKEALALNLLLNTLASLAPKVSWHPDYEELLEVVTKLYDINDCYHLDPDPDSNSESEVAPVPSLLSPSSSSSSSGSQRNLGWQLIQKKVLYLCIKFSNAYNDHEYVAKYALTLINGFRNILNKSEQQELLQNYLKPSISKKLLRYYWDPFILRDIKIRRLESDDLGILGAGVPTKALLADIKKTRGSSETSGDKTMDTHKIYNPFKKCLTIDSTETGHGEAHSTAGVVVLVSDRAELTCQLQNPFKFDIYVTGVQFPAEILEFCELDNSYFVESWYFTVKAESVTSISLPLLFKKPTRANHLSIQRLSISVFDTESKVFNVVSLEGKNNVVINPTDSDVASKVHNKVDYRLKILPEQPRLQVVSGSRTLDDPLMVLDGTSSSFALQLRNTSLSSSIDYLEFETITDVEQELKSDYWKNMSADDLYDKEKQLEYLRKSCIRIKNPPKAIKPNEIVTVEFEVNLTNISFDVKGFTMTVRYGMITSDEQYVYLKEISIPYDITVMKTVEVSGLDVISLNEQIVSDKASCDWIRYINKELENSENLTVNDFALLLIDFRNSWPNGILLDTSFDDFETKGNLVESDHTLRIVVPIRKINPEEHDFSRKKIPSIVQGRQFIQSGMTEDQEIELRENFWCREYILERLKSRWTVCQGGSSSGVVGFRKFLGKFDDKIASIIYEGKSLFKLSLLADKTELAVFSPVTVTAKVEPMKVRRLSKNQEVVCLKLLIFYENNTKLLSVTNRRMLCNGTLSRTMRITRQGEAKFELLPIEPGSYEICAAVASVGDKEHLLQFNAENIYLNVTSR